MWTRKLAWPDDNRPDDWIILWDGKVVGRVSSVLLNNPSRTAWHWFKQWGHGATGEAEMLEQACEDLRAFIIKHGEWHVDAGYGA